MECEVCNSRFNHSKKKPLSLYPCFHTFCSKCIEDWKENTCPNCRVKIKDKNINWTLLKLIPEEDAYQAKLKLELDTFLKEAELLNKEFEQTFSLKLKENKNKANKLNDQINKKYNELLKVLQNNRNKLTEKIATIEKELNNQLNEINLTEKNNFDLIRKILEEEDDELDTNKINEFKQEINIKFDQIKFRLEQLKSIDIIGNHDIKLNDTSYVEVNLIGDILITKNQSSDLNNNSLIKNEELLPEATTISKDETPASHIETKLQAQTSSKVNNSMFTSIKHPEERKGIEFIKRQKFERALECFDRLISAQPQYHRAYLWKSKVLFYLRRFTESDQYFNKTIELKTDCDEAYYCKGNSLIRLENYTEAIKCFDKAIELSAAGDSWLAVNQLIDEVFYGKATCLNQLKNYTEAIIFYDRALFFNPCSEKAYLGKGRLLNSLGQHSEAIKCFNKVIKFNPRNDKAYCGKSVSLQSLNKPDEALKCVNKAIDLNPLGFAEFEREQRKNAPKEF